MKKDFSIVVLPSFYPMELNYTRGGFFEEQTKLIKQQNIEISVIFNEDRSLKSFTFQKLKYIHFQRQLKIEDGVPVLRKLSWNLIPTKFELGRKIWISTAIKLAEYFIENVSRPDVIHVHCAFNAGFVALYLKRKYHVPYIITEHSTLFSSAQFSARQKEEVFDIYHHAAEVIVVSNPFRKLLADKIGFDEDRIRVLPNFIDTDYFKPFSTGKHPDKNKIIFTVCHHDQKKRLDRLVDAFELVLNEYPDWKLIIGGSGRLTRSLLNKVSQMGLTDSITFCGFLSKAEVRERMNIAGIFVLPSDVETFGVVLIEAMAMGLPVVSTQSGGPEDIITKETGVLVDKNVKSLAEGICAVILNRSSYDPKLIRQHVLDNFSGPVVSEKYIRLYEDCIRNHRLTSKPDKHEA
jgi:glycosyltransferase involved in cell wall biosynthesis